MVTQIELSETQLKALVADAAGTTSDKVFIYKTNDGPITTKVEADLKAANKVKRILDKHIKPGPE